MELEIFERQLTLLRLLTNNRQWSAHDLADRLRVNVRTIYRYIELFKNAGFLVRKIGKHYSIDPRSPFFAAITDRYHFSEDEAIVINQLLCSTVSRSPQMRHLRSKLASLYDFEVLSRHGVDEHVARNLSSLYEAMRLEQVVVLRNYSSPHSQNVSDRAVEPYLFLSENTEVRCFELSSQMNKTFKISRAESIEILDIAWSNKQRHAPFYTDLFHFSGEEQTEVKLLLGKLSSSLLLEEVPQALQQMELQEDGRYLLTTQVCSFVGIARFVLGLFDDIEIVDSPDFQKYLYQKIENLTEKIK